MVPEKIKLAVEKKIDGKIKGVNLKKLENQVLKDITKFVNTEISLIVVRRYKENSNCNILEKLINFDSAFEDLWYNKERINNKEGFIRYLDSIDNGTPYQWIKGITLSRNWEGVSENPHRKTLIKLLVFLDISENEWGAWLHEDNKLKKSKTEIDNLQEKESRLKNIRPAALKQIIGFYKAYRIVNELPNNNKFVADCAALSERNDKLVLQYKSEMFEYDFVYSDYNNPDFYVVLHNGQNKIRINMHIGYLRRFEIIVAYYFYNYKKLMSGVILFHKQSDSANDYTNKEPYELNISKLNRPESLIYKYIKYLYPISDSIKLVRTIDEI